MSFGKLLQQLVVETTQTSLCHFAPELAICVTIVLMLLMRLVSLDRWIPAYFVALVGSVCSLGLAGTQLLDLVNGTAQSGEFFGGMLMFDAFGAFVRSLLALFLVLVIALTVLSGIPDREDGPDFYTLMLGSTLGMMLMAQANNLLMFFLGVEMTSVPSYVMVGFLKGRRLSSEAAFKYVVYGAGAAGVMLYGISLLAGLLGTASLPELSSQLAIVLGSEAGIGDAVSRTLVLAILMVLVGLAFKLSIVPFHFWCPDAFEGASAEVAGFLSVGSKGAAFALLVRFVYALVGGDVAVMPEVFTSLGVAVGVIAAVTITFGNLAAYSQTNIKRLLAYSTIAHAGYMLLAVSALMVILSGGRSIEGFDYKLEAARCLEGLMFYLFVYLFMNLGAFAVTALIRNYVFSEKIDDFNGVAWEAPALCSCMMVCLFSLVGLPPLGGFWGKLVIFMSLFASGQIHWFMYVLLGIAGLNTVFSLVYYIRILQAMFIKPRAEGARPIEVPTAISNYAMLLAIPVLLLGMFPTWTTELARKVATTFVE